MRKAGTFMVCMVLILMMHRSAQASSSPALTGLVISGPSSIMGGKSETYTATASYGNGASAQVTPSLWYVSPPTYATFSPSGVLTAKAVTAQQKVTVYASYTEGGVTQTKAVSVSIAPASTAASSLTGLAISGPSTIEGGKSETYTATASYGNGASAKVAPSLWYVTPPTYAAISPSGALTTKAVTAQQTVTVYASYTEGGVTQTKTVTVAIAPSSASNSTSQCASGALYQATLPDGSTGSVCLGMKKVMTPSGESKLRGTATWSGFAGTAESAAGSTFTFAWENYESDPDAGTLYENNPAQGALFVLAYAFPGGNCSGGASFFAVIEALGAVSLKDLGASLKFTPLFGQICGTAITTLNSYTLARQ